MVLINGTYKILMVLISLLDEISKVTTSLNNLLSHIDIRSTNMDYITNQIKYNYTYNIGSPTKSNQCFSFAINNKCNM